MGETQTTDQTPAPDQEPAIVSPEYQRGWHDASLEYREKLRNRDDALGGIRADFAAFVRVVRGIPGFTYREHAGLKQTAEALAALVGDARTHPLAAENRRLKAMLLAIHSTVDGGWPRMDAPTREYWLRQADNPEWAEWFGGAAPKNGARHDH